MRTYGTGMITRMDDKPKSKCRKWRLRVKVDGRERTRCFKGTYSAAEVALDRFKAELEISIKSMLFKDYAAKWIAKRRRDPDIQQSTVRSNETDVRRLVAIFGDIMMHELTRPIIEDGLDRIRNGENATGKTLSGTTMNKTYSTLSQMLQSASYDGIIPSNPCSVVKPPKREQPSRRAIPYDELKTVLERLYAMPMTSYTMAVRIAVLAGLRRGEIVALRWEDVKDGCLKVTASIDENTGKRKSTKTTAGRRSVPMLPMLAEDMEKWRDMKETAFASVGEELRQSTPVIISSNGNHMRAQVLYKWWIHHRWELGTDAGLHELRHTFLTLIANSGANMAVLKSIAGWSDLSVASAYIHEDVEASRRAVDNLAKYIVRDSVRDNVRD